MESYDASIVKPLRYGSLDHTRHALQHQPAQLYLLAWVIDVDADQIAGVVLLEHDTVGDFTTLHAVALRQVDVPRVGVRIVVELHGLNRRSGNAL